MTKKPSTDILTAPDRIQQMVHVVRGQRLMLSGVLRSPTAVRVNIEERL
jgi:hypothetical protein